jgi:D-sedoheptulose 7-phosphate isomerase
VSKVLISTEAERRVAELLARRAAANGRFFQVEAARIARLCHRMAERFARGGRLVALGATPAGRSDARHIAVEFVHPVIVGKRALPALALTREGSDLPLQMELVVGSDDIAVAFDTDSPEVGAESCAALRAAVEKGCLTVAFSEAGAEWEFPPPSEDPFVRQELVETLYHVLWELVHVFFEHPGLLSGRDERPVHDTGASSFLYPFLGQQEHDLDVVMADVRRSVLLKAEEVTALRVRTVSEGREALLAAAGALRRVFDTGGTLLAFGNGGSATDVMDLVADLRSAPQGWRARRALDLTEDSAILTALMNDIGTDSIFARQIIAWGRPGDAVLALSTSGNSRNVIQALQEARRRGLVSIALVGYDGGRVLAEGLADHVIVTRSEHIPRIQEAQATAYHLLRELVEFTR